MNAALLISLGVILFAIIHEEKLIDVEDKVWAKFKLKSKKAILRIRLALTRVKIFFFDIGIVICKSIIKLFEKQGENT